MRSVKVQKPGRALAGSLSFPGDKSLSHRAIIFGSLAEGNSSFTNVLEAEDCRCTQKAFEALGVPIHRPLSGKLEIEGRGLRGLKAPGQPLYLGNSGTSMRLLLGVLAGQPFETVLTGDASLSNRPMRRVADFLKQMGARVEGRQDADFAPLKIRGGELRGIDARLPVASAQVKSALLLAGLYAKGVTRVTEPEKSRDHTERFLKYFGVKIKEEGLTVSIEGGQKLRAGADLRARPIEIPGDISSAAFFMAIAALFPDSKISFQNVLWNPTRTGVVEVLKRMGVEFNNLSVNEKGPEPVADFSLLSQSLKAFEIKKEELPSLIDEIPLLTVLATQAGGTSVIHEADELRVKETDRIRSMVTNLSEMGADIAAKGNTILIKGPTRLRGAQVDSFKDHRTAMSCVVAGLIAEGQAEVRDLDCVNTSFPEFFSLLEKLGIDFNLC